MRVVCVLLFAALITLPEYSFAQTVTPETDTFPVPSIGVGMLRTKDRAVVFDYNPLGLTVHVAVGSTTTCNRGTTPNIPEAVAAAPLAALSLFSAKSMFETT